MTKWLGKESSEQVKRLCSVHVGNPQAALRKAWERLRECYAAPEIIEKSMFQRLENFPKISAKDNVKLRDLGDLLMEIQGAKEDGYLTGLTYLDTSRGISPIIEKLPFALQEKWISAGSWYKEQNQGRFPPFEYFSDFVCSEAKKRNDPSFMNQGNTVTLGKSDRGINRSFNINKTVLVTKTDVSTTDDPNKTCPLHNKPHPLRKCRVFRNKSISDRMALLKEKGICFKCCSSVSHFSRDCKVVLKCSECNSVNHDTAMHPEPSPKFAKVSSSQQDNGGEN